MIIQVICYGIVLFEASSELIASEWTRLDRVTHPDRKHTFKKVKVTK